MAEDVVLLAPKGSGIRARSADTPRTSAFDLGVSGLNEAYRLRRHSPVEVVSEAVALARMARDELGAFVTIAEAQALDAASVLERKIENGEDTGPLSGIPVTVKDNIATAGIRTTFGSSAFASHIPDTDAECIRRLRRAGAIIIGKTATPEFACRQTTSSSVSGVARNPWNRELTPGGSSGGSSAATAAGAGMVSIVTDGGGSARLPAACTGLVGFKPTFGQIPFDSAADAFAGLAHIGLIGRRVQDVRLVFEHLRGRHPTDPYSLCSKLASPSQSVSQTRIGWRLRLAQEPIDAEVEEACQQAVRILEKDGAAVVELSDPVEAPLPVWRVLQHTIWASRFGRNDKLMANIDDVIAAGVSHAASLSAIDLQDALYARTRLFRSVQGWFADCDFVLSPTLTRPAVAADHPGFGPIDVAGLAAGDIREAWAPQLGLLTMTGHPCLTLNCGWTSTGLPIGLHVSARWQADDALLGFAELVGRRLGA